MSELNTIEEAKAVLQGIEEGKLIQFYLKFDGKLSDSNDVNGGALPNFGTYKYRVKPAPREVYMKELPAMDVGAYYWSECGKGVNGAVLFREVIK